MCEFSLKIFSPALKQFYYFLENFTSIQDQASVVLLSTMVLGGPQSTEIV